MPIDVIKGQKEIAINLRKKGMSYGEIREELALPKSTISNWLKNTDLTEVQRERLTKKRSQTAKLNIKKYSDKLKIKKAEIFCTASNSIKNISDRELWLMGIILYGSEKPTVQFMSSDVMHIKLFISWLFIVGGLTEEDIMCDIFLQRKKLSSKENEIEQTKSIEEIPDDLNEELKSILYWSQKTCLSKDDFKHIYFQKSYPQKNIRDRKNKNEHGQLRIRVKASSLLAFQLAGWRNGVFREICKKIS